jgi:hypothetical protein
MKLLGLTEKQDFEAIVADAGFPKEDFELTETGFITGVVTVRRKSTGVSRQYSAGSQKIWLSYFQADLRGGKFGYVHHRRAP